MKENKNNKRKNEEETNRKKIHKKCLSFACQIYHSHEYVE